MLRSFIRNKWVVVDSARTACEKGDKLEVTGVVRTSNLILNEYPDKILDENLRY